MTCNYALIHFKYWSGTDHNIGDRCAVYNPRETCDASHPAGSDEADEHTHLCKTRFVWCCRRLPQHFVLSQKRFD